MKNLFVLLFGGIMLLACGPSHPSDPVALDLDSAYRSRRPVFLSEVADSISYVCLRVPDSLHTGAVSSLYMSGDYFLLVPFDMGLPPLLFDGRGNYLARLGADPEGRPVYKGSNGRALIAPDDERVVLTHGKYVTRFDLQGRIVAQDSFEYNRGFIGGSGGDGNSFLYVNELLPDTLVMMHGTFGALTRCDTFPGLYFASRFSFSRPDGTIGNTYVKHIYYLPAYALFYDFPGGDVYRFYYDGRLENAYKITGSQKKGGLSLVETDRYLFYSLMAKGAKEGIFIYDRLTGDLSCSDSLNMVNDLDGGIGFFPSGLSPDGRLFGKRSAQYFKRYAAQSANPRFRAFARSLPDDGIVAVVVRLKD